MIQDCGACGEPFDCRDHRTQQASAAYCPWCRIRPRDVRVAQENVVAASRWVGITRLTEAARNAPGVRR